MSNGVAFHLFCMIGFPGETEAEAVRTLRFADEAMRVAREEHGNACCTKGVGTFGLEKGSPIWKAPEAFGVTLDPPPPEHDLVLDSVYRVSEGLSAEQAAEVVDGYSGMDVYRAIAGCRQVSYVNRRLSPSPPREEETFIRWACDGRSELPGLRLDEPGVASVSRVNICPGPRGPMAVDAKRCLVYPLDPATADLLRRVRNGGADPVYTAAAHDIELARDVARLDRLGLVDDVPACFAARDLAPEMILTAWITPFAEVDFLYLPGEDYYLFDPHREAAIRLNHSGALLWEMARGGARGLSLLDRAQAVFGPAMTAERFAGFVNHLSRNGAWFVSTGATG